MKKVLVAKKRARNRGARLVVKDENSLLLGHVYSLFQVCARTKGRIHIAGNDQGPCRTVASLRGYGLDMLRQTVQKILGNCVSGFGSVQQQNSNIPGARRRDLLGLYHGIIRTGAKSCDSDANRQDRGLSQCM